MKFLKLVPLLFAVIIFNACSSDSGSSSVDTTDSFTYKVEGVDVPVPQ
jgi:hypothetical protein